MGKIMEKFTDSVARKIWNQMEEEQRKCEESKIQTITEKQIKEFGESLYETEHSDNTIQRYCQEVRKFMEFLDGGYRKNNFSWNIGIWKRNNIMYVRLMLRFQRLMHILCGVKDQN